LVEFSSKKATAAVPIELNLKDEESPVDFSGGSGELTETISHPHKPDNICRLQL
jgi:hypothetical protein